MSWIFNKIINSNLGTKNEIKIVTLSEKNGKRPVAKENLPLEKTLFISHSSKDKDIVGPFVRMLLDAGFPREKLLYSSDPALGVPLGEKFEEYLHQKLTEGTFVIFMLSNNWCGSAVCQNEVGAVWHGNLRHCNVLLPSFSYHDIKGVVSSSELSISYDDDIPILRDKLGQLKRQLEKHFDMEFIDSAWEKSRDQFLGSTHCDPAVPRPL